MSLFVLTKHDALLSIEALQTGTQYYIGNHIAADDPRVSPIFDDLHGLPPTLVQVGSKEILLDDAKRFREKLKMLVLKFNSNFIRACGITSRCLMLGLMRLNKHWQILLNLPTNSTKLNLFINDVNRPQNFSHHFLLKSHHI